MRKIVALIMITLDGVRQSPGSPTEDTENGFKYGGWTVPFSDDGFGEILAKELSQPFDMLLGRKTYEIFANYWPDKTGFIADPFNRSTKYVVTHNSLTLNWNQTTQISGNIVEEIKKLKAGDGTDIQIWGSSNLLQTLLKNDLVDELRLRIYPITIGSGKKLFAEGTIPALFKLIDTHILKSAVIMANFKREGEFETGTME